MIVWLAGETLSAKLVDEVLRAQHEEAAERTRRAIEFRTSRGVPLDDGDGPLEPIGAYEPDPATADVSFVARAITFAEQAEIEAMLAAGYRAIHDSGDRGPLLAARRKVLELAVERVDGVTRADGAAVSLCRPWSPAEFEILLANGLLTPVTQAAMYVMTLRGEARKNCGASPSSISPPTTATHAPNPSGANVGATEEAQSATPAPVRALRAASS